MVKPAIRRGKRPQEPQSHWAGGYLGMKLSRETAVILAICLADLLTTIWLVRCHGAVEANPLMRPFLDHGLFTFVLAKSFFCLAPLAVLEWARRQHPVFVQTALRTGIAL